MVDTYNPYQLYSNPLPKLPSSGNVGDFLRNAFTPAPVASTTRVPTAPTTQVPIAPTIAQGPILPSPDTLTLQDRAAIFNRAQLQGGLAGQPTPISTQRPALAQAVQRTGLPAYDNQSVLVRAPKGYMAPTAEDIATSNAVRNSYWAPYRRQVALQDRRLDIEQLKALNQRKAPTLRDQLFGKAYDALQEQYKLEAAAAKIARDPGWFAGEEEHKKAQAIAELEARQKFLKNLRNLAQPKTAEADLLSPDKD